MDLTDEQRAALLIPGAQPIGRMHNKWRKRMVLVYPTRDPNQVHCIGESTVIPIGTPRPETVETIEPREHWEHVIRRFPRTSVFE